MVGCFNPMAALDKAKEYASDAANAAANAAYDTVADAVTRSFQVKNDSCRTVWMKYGPREDILTAAAAMAVVGSVAAAPFTGGGSLAVASVAMGALMVSAGAAAVNSYEAYRKSLKDGGYTEVKPGETFEGPWLPPSTPMAVSIIADPPDPHTMSAVMQAVAWEGAMVAIPGGKQAKGASAAVKSFKAASKAGKPSKAVSKEFAKGLKKDMSKELAKETGKAAGKEIAKDATDDAAIKAANLAAEAAHKALIEKMNLEIEALTKELRAEKTINTWTAPVTSGTYEPFLYELSDRASEIVTASKELFDLKAFCDSLMDDVEKEMKE